MYLSLALAAPKVRIQHRTPSDGAEARREVYVENFQQEGRVRGAGHRNVHLGKQLTSHDVSHACDQAQKPTERVLD